MDYPVLLPENILQRYILILSEPPTKRQTPGIELVFIWGCRGIVKYILWNELSEII